MEWFDNDAVRKIIANVEKSAAVPPKPGVISKGVWEEKMLDAIVENLQIPSEVWAKEKEQAILTRFFNFYFYGERGSGVRPHQVVFPVICLFSVTMEDNSELMYFAGIPRGDNGFFRLPAQPDALDEFLTQEYTPDTLPFESIKHIEDRETVAKMYIEPTKESPVKFRQEVKEILQNWTKIDKTKQIELRHLAAYLALVLMRGIVKDVIQLTRGFNKTAMKTHIANLAGWIGAYSPPCKACIERCVIDFSRVNRWSIRMFSLIVYQWRTYISAEPSILEFMPQIHATLLTHTAGNGLSLYVLMVAAVRGIGGTTTELMQLTLTKKSSPSWTPLSECMGLYGKGEGLTFMWARVINDAYLTDLAAKNHAYLAGIFAGIIAADQTIGTIKESNWFSTNQLRAHAGYRLGQELVRDMKQAPDEGMFPETKAALKALQRGRDSGDVIDEPEVDTSISPALW